MTRTKDQAQDRLHKEVLENEAVAFSRYLIGKNPGPDLIARYVEANRVLFPDAPDARDRAVLDWCRRHPRTLPLIDAAAGFADRAHGRSRFRQKLLVMTAILEATTRFAPRFLPPEKTTLGDLARVGAMGGVASLKVALGLPLYWIVGGSGR